MRAPRRLPKATLLRLLNVWTGNNMAANCGLRQPSVCAVIGIWEKAGEDVPVDMITMFQTLEEYFPLSSVSLFWCENAWAVNLYAPTFNAQLCRCIYIQTHMHVHHGWNGSWKKKKAARSVRLSHFRACVEVWVSSAAAKTRNSIRLELIDTAIKTPAHAPHNREGDTHSLSQLSLTRRSFW